MKFHPSCNYIKYLILTGEKLPNIENIMEEVDLVPPTELMFVNAAIANMIRESKAHQIYTAIQAGGKRGMMTMDMSLAGLYKRGGISRDLSMEKAHNREEMQRMIV